jgi:hypothetical protein
MKKIPGILPFLGLLLLEGCSTYHVSTESLLGQFAGTGTEMKEAPILFYKAVRGNDLKFIHCLDDKGNEAIIEVTNRTGIRITKMDNSKTTFYFDTLILKDSSITGSKTHYANAPIKPIKFSEISKIEIQK